ncbi:HHIP-like protein 1 isoform X2 [Paramacrobiotus metropolitanus]|uniref:HHIP-like protein 1 isoform X2 n=1 Tax=Paramacrobiotus metropolitanus TaxID=2943436 RepID=UPI0024459673|nr:HHIP-like protein 1 isoform X2 [Paramacrobiotus metropolitanus]
MLCRLIQFVARQLIPDRFRCMVSRLASIAWAAFMASCCFMTLANCVKSTWPTLPSRHICLNLVNDLLHNPVDITEILHTGKLLIAERDGKIQLIDVHDAKSFALSPELILDISDKVLAKGDHMGVLGIAVHPRFKLNGFVFIMYSAETDDREFHHRQRISRFALLSTNGSEIDKFSETVLLEIYQSAPTGGQIWFGSDDHLLHIAVGDGSRSRRSRFDRGMHSGKILRINVDVDLSRDGNVPYKIPDDNPFAHQPSTLLPEVFAYGLQNPWRCSEERREMKRGTAQIRIICIDVGPKFSDFNIIQKGGMYGFMDEAFSPCHDLDNCRNTTKLKSEFRLPICRYPGVAVGGVFYNPWNSYLFADYMRGSLHYLKPTGSGSVWMRGPVEVVDNETCAPAHRPLTHQTVLNLHQVSDRILYMLTVSNDQTAEPNGHLYRISMPKWGSLSKRTGNTASQLTVNCPIFVNILCLLYLFFLLRQDSFLSALTRVIIP